jgi:Na+/H+-dicarboxylate symporter
MPRFAKSLFGQVVIALVLGVLAGLFAPEYAASSSRWATGSSSSSR